MNRVIIRFGGFCPSADAVAFMAVLSYLAARINIFPTFSMAPRPPFPAVTVARLSGAESLAELTKEPGNEC